MSTALWMAVGIAGAAGAALAGWYISRRQMPALRALDAGADDFVSKPFDLSVLLAKVQALLRRAYAFAGQSALLTCGDLMLNASDGAVTCRGQRAELTRNENRILTVLMENKGKIVSRDALMARLWETDAFVDENTLKMCIRDRPKGIEDLLAALAELLADAGADAVGLEELGGSARGLDVEAHVIEAADEGQGLGLVAVGNGHKDGAVVGHVHARGLHGLVELSLIHI